MSDLDPEKFTLRQAAQARDDFAQIGRVGFSERAVSPSAKPAGSGIHAIARHVRVSCPQLRERYRLARTFLASLPLNGTLSHRPCTHRVENVRPGCRRCRPARRRLWLRLALFRRQRSSSDLSCSGNSPRAAGCTKSKCSSVLSSRSARGSSSRCRPASSFSPP